MDDYGETKVYYDGSHYIAIPHTTRPKRQRKVFIEDEIEVPVNETSAETSNTVQQESKVKSEVAESEKTENKEQVTESKAIEKPKETRKIKPKDLFTEYYKQYYSENKKVRRKLLIEAMTPYFRTVEDATTYVDKQLENKRRNEIARHVRMWRKANLQEFNYFCTFTYDDNKHTEVSFKKQLRTAFRHLTERRGWKYMGVWERSPDKQRLHFHGLFYIPQMIGELVERDDYSYKLHDRLKTLENTYFAERFGRNVFGNIDTPYEKAGALQYIIKYLEKSGERMVYSKGLPQYFISDVLAEDIVCEMGDEQYHSIKLLLFDDFTCWDQGCLMGKVSKEVIAQMRKSN